MRTSRSQSGLTLVELLWAMVGSSIILAGLASALQGTVMVHADTTQEQRLQQSARVILENLQMAIRNASDATCPGTSELQLEYEESNGTSTFTNYVVENGGLTRVQGSERVPLIPANSTFQIQPFEVQLLREYIPIKPEYDGAPTQKEVTIVVRLDVEFTVGEKTIIFHSSTALRQNY